MLGEELTGIQQKIFGEVIKRWRLFPVSNDNDSTHITPSVTDSATDSVIDSVIDSVAGSANATHAHTPRQLSTEFTVTIPNLPPSAGLGLVMRTDSASVVVAEDTESKQDHTGDASSIHNPFAYISAFMDAVNQSGQRRSADISQDFWSNFWRFTLAIMHLNILCVSVIQSENSKGAALGAEDTTAIRNALIQYYLDDLSADDRKRIEYFFKQTLPVIERILAALDHCLRGVEEIYPDNVRKNRDKLLKNVDFGAGEVPTDSDKDAYITSTQVYVLDPIRLVLRQFETNLGAFETPRGTRFPVPDVSAMSFARKLIAELVYRQYLCRPGSRVNITEVIRPVPGHVYSSQTRRNLQRKHTHQQLAQAHGARWSGKQVLGFIAFYAVHLVLGVLLAKKYLETDKMRACFSFLSKDVGDQDAAILVTSALVVTVVFALEYVVWRGIKKCRSRQGASSTNLSRTERSALMGGDVREQGGGASYSSLDVDGERRSVRSSETGPNEAVKCCC